MLADLMALKTGTLQMSDLLGVMTLYSMPNRPVKLVDYQSAWLDAGLPGATPVSKQHPVHLFQRACDSVKSGGRGVPQGNRVVEITSDCVSHDSQACVYQITRLIRDKDAQLITHKRALTIQFLKVASLGVDPIEVLMADADMDGIAEKIRDYVDVNAETVTGQKIRESVRSTIVNLGATNLQGKGCYFVPIAGLQIVERLQLFLAGLYGADASMDTIPWLNTEATRKIVHKHHVSNVRERCDVLVAEISGYLAQDKKPRSDKMANTLNARRELGQLAKEYKELLGQNVGAAEEALDLLDDQVEALMEMGDRQEVPA